MNVVSFKAHLNATPRLLKPTIRPSFINPIKQIRHQKRSTRVIAMSAPPSTFAALALLAGAAALFTLNRILKFIRADGDMRLLSKQPPPANAFKDKVVWIVGASQGLGETIAKEFAASGAKIILSSRSLDKLQAVANQLFSVGDTKEENVHVLPLDVTGDIDHLEDVTRQAFQSFNGSGVDYVVHVAGASQHATAEETEVQVANTLLQLNLIGPLALTRATLPLMLAQGRGRHVVVTSMSSVVPSPGQCVYAAAKAGLRAYFHSVASELADRGVGVTVCCPGPFQPNILDSTKTLQKPRSVYGATGLMEQQVSTGLSSKRVPARRVAQLILTAAYHGLDEVWIAQHPVLLMGYLMQYVPWLGMRVLKKIGPGRARQLRDGSGSGYDVGKMLVGNSDTKKAA